MHTPRGFTSVNWRNNCGGRPICCRDGGYLRRNVGVEIGQRRFERSRVAQSLADSCDMVGGGGWVFIPKSVKFHLISAECCDCFLGFFRRQTLRTDSSCRFSYEESFGIIPSKPSSFNWPITSVKHIHATPTPDSRLLSLHLFSFHSIRDFAQPMKGE